VLATIVHSLLAVETAAQQGRKVVLVMLGTGGVFVCVIALGELSHWVAKQRRRSRES
jgi:hypothetical protein